MQKTEAGIATIRLGVWGAVGVGTWGVLVTAGAVAATRVPSAAFAQRWFGALGSLYPIVVLGTLTVNVALLIYLAFRVKRQSRAYHRNEVRLRRQVAEISLLQEAISAIHDLRAEDALQSVVEIVTHVMGFQRAALYLCEPSEDLVPQTYQSCRHSSQRVYRSPIAIEAELLAVLCQLRDPVVLSGAPEDTNCDGAPDGPGQRPLRGPTRGALRGGQIAVPLYSERGSLGVLVADCHDRQASNQADKELLAHLAKSAVVAIENARLHQGIRRLANHDGLTNLYNYRYFQQSLREAVQSDGGRAPVSLLMIELDKFKWYNDTFGHRQGDKALCCFARALQEGTEPWKRVVARYGGDEFVVVLPGVGPGAAMQVAETLHQEVYERAKTALAEVGLPPVTMSVGVATFPSDAPNADLLIEAADRAMYKVKYEGGDQVCAYATLRTLTRGGETGLNTIGTNDCRHVGRATGV